MISNSSPFVTNVSSQYTPTSSSSIFANMGVGNGAGKFAQEVPSFVSSNFNKMDVEDPFIISETLNNATSRSGGTSCNVKNNLIFIDKWANPSVFTWKYTNVFVF